MNNNYKTLTFDLSLYWCMYSLWEKYEDLPYVYLLWLVICSCSFHCVGGVGLLTIPHRNIIFMWEILFEALEASLPGTSWPLYIITIYIDFHICFLMQRFKWIVTAHIATDVCITHIITLIHNLIILIFETWFIST